MKLTTLLSVALAAVLALPGCAEAKKQAECKSLIEAINPHTTKVRKLSDDMPADASLEVGAKAFTAMAAEVEAGAADVKKLEIETPELKKFAADYQTMCAGSSKAFKDMVAVTEKIGAAQKLAATNPEAAQADAAKAQTDAANAEAEIKKATAPEDTIIDGINTFCGATKEPSK